MKLFIFSLTAATTLGCSACQGPLDKPGSSSLAAASNRRFAYDAASGTCVDSYGQQGLNPLNVRALFGNQPTSAQEARLGAKNASCVDFSAVNIHDYMHPSDEATWYTSLKSWNLAGAVLSGNDLRFTTISQADLRGTDLTGVTLGYSSINGTADSYTKTDSVCTVSGDQVSCVR